MSGAFAQCIKADRASILSVGRGVAKIMFIIFGIRDIKLKVKGGLEVRKHCGRCGLLSDMQERRWTKFFTLFFVPLIPISKGERVLVCTRCKAAFYPQAEDYRQGALPFPVPAIQRARRNRSPVRP
ncbi:MAG: zinc ribbon domain-containing protein [Blastocatellia bacterium]|nr:zinc ribbon domain-containing protein [Blastocatellia bacterium]